MKDFTNALKFGSIAGAIMILGWLAGNWILAPGEGENYDFSTGEILGYAAMILALTMVFIGVKNHRDKELGGFVSFGKAFKTGLYIVLVTSVIYVVGWMIYYPNFMPDFIDQYTEYQIQQYEEEGLSDTEIETKKREMQEWGKLYEQPLVMAGFTFLEIFPVGLLMALISAFILRKSPE